MRVAVLFLDALDGCGRLAPLRDVLDLFHGGWLSGFAKERIWQAIVSVGDGIYESLISSADLPSTERVFYTAMMVLASS